MWQAGSRFTRRTHAQQQARSKRQFRFLSSAPQNLTFFFLLLLQGREAEKKRRETAGQKPQAEKSDLCRCSHTPLRGPRQSVVVASPSWLPPSLRRNSPSVPTIHPLPGQRTRRKSPPLPVHHPSTIPSKYSLRDKRAWFRAWPETAIPAPALPGWSSNSISTPRRRLARSKICCCALD